ncbi:Uncharacterised protein [Raoultella ornithinolytica]|nr:Uncharacterised protein [Raoultella ornithinolytica]
MNIDHPDTQLCRSGYRPRGGVRDIMKFQVKEDLKTTLMQVANKLWPEQRKHLFAHLQAAVAWINAVNKGQRFVAVIIIERNNNGRGCDNARRR